MNPREACRTEQSPSQLTAMLSGRHPLVTVERASTAPRSIDGLEESIESCWPLGLVAAITLTSKALPEDLFSSGPRPLQATTAVTAPSKCSSIHYPVHFGLFLFCFFFGAVLTAFVARELIPRAGTWGRSRVAGNFVEARWSAPSAARRPQAEEWKHTWDRGAVDARPHRCERSALAAAVARVEIGVVHPGYRSG